MSYIGYIAVHLSLLLTSGNRAGCVNCRKLGDEAGFVEQATTSIKCLQTVRFQLSHKLQLL